jgi:hypothetical protein
MRGSPIFIVLFAILAVLWLGGFLIFHVASALIHLLLLLAVISLVTHFFLGKGYTPEIKTPT